MKEVCTRWASHKHPEDPNFMQVVRYLHVQYSDGRNHLYWSLFNASANDNHTITNISLSDAQSRYTDALEVEITEDAYNEWLKTSK